jgi:hypothetical protein
VRDANVRRRDLEVSLGLFLLGVLSRLPFRSEWLSHWDSVNFALALEHYDVRIHQPQPPGYFLYVLLGRGVHLLVPDANAALVWLSLLAGALGIVTIYHLGAALFNRRVGAVAAVLALTSPAVWFYGEVALSYAVEFALVSVFVLILYWQVEVDHHWWPATTLLLGIIGGVRQNSIVFLLPLWLVCLLSLRWRQRFLSLLLLTVVGLAWLLPMMALSGGPAAYLATLSTASVDIAEESSFLVASQLAVNGGRMAFYLGYGLLLAALPLAWGTWWAGRNWRTLIRDRRFWMLVLWIGPAFGFYLVVHLRQHGHIFTFLPALLILSAASIVGLSRRLKRAERRRIALGGLVSVVALVNAAFFLAAPAALFGSSRLPLQTPSRRTIERRDQELEVRVTAIRDRFDPSTTAVWATGIYFRHPDYYLRNFRHVGLGYLSGEGDVLLDADVDILVLFNAGAEQVGDPAWLSHLPLPDGEQLAYIECPAGRRFLVAQDSVRLR